MTTKMTDDLAARNNAKGSNGSKIISAYFERVSDGWSAVHRLLDAGIPREHISFIATEAAMKDLQQHHDHQNVSSTEKGSTGSGIAVGSLVGGTAGTLLSLLAAAALPGVGAVLAFGPLFSAFAGMTAGSVAGGFIGARVKWQQADEETQAFYEEGLRRGGSLVFVNASAADSGRIRQLLQQDSGLDMHDRAKQWQAEGWNPATAASTPTEREVAENEKNKPDNASRSGKFPGVPPFSEMIPTYQEHFASTFAKAGQSFDDYSAGYMYGYNLANDERYRDQQWSQIEEEIRLDWQNRQYRNWAELNQIIQFARDKALGRT